jgi:hypothetical protein
MAAAFSIISRSPIGFIGSWHHFCWLLLLQLIWHWHFAGFVVVVDVEVGQFVDGFLVQNLCKFNRRRFAAASKLKKNESFLNIALLKFG